ncbi:hypothetical protein E1193_27760 [Micromonospora sp. KC606]|uniref:hypothetical protein n=1 Tax=Micromonospora sp. KC606 TaxID=2530379 RepID=UPI00105347FE|nr:hypothetical protein [Micromonospora sp. KC606]TDC72415.1 hypothetical protein E1193_27760 [Micromonospora sp. KC606]
MRAAPQPLAVHRASGQLSAEVVITAAPYDIEVYSDTLSLLNSGLTYIWSQYGVADRYCRNTHGNGTWARCNFDWSEDGTKRVRGGVRYSYHSWAAGHLWEFSGK